MWKESDDNILDEEKITRKFMPAAQIRRLWKGRVIAMSILSTTNLTKLYGSGANEVHALKDVNFNVEKGEFVAVVGTSGSGKSTLLHIQTVQRRTDDLPKEKNRLCFSKL